MKDLLDKLSSYNIFNYLLPGVLFAVFADRFTPYSMMTDNIVIGAFVYYFYGLVISRLGSLFLEPLLKRANFIRFAPYPEFLRASKVDSKVELFSEVNNMYRTLLSVFICLLLLRLFALFESAYPPISKYSSVLGIFLLTALFLFSYRKQTRYVAKRIKEAIKSQDTTETTAKENKQ